MTACGTRPRRFRKVQSDNPVIQLKIKVTAKLRVTTGAMLIWLLTFNLLVSETFAAGELGAIRTFIGKNDSIFVADPIGRVVLSANADEPLIPASTLKILTSLVAIHYLGLDYHFATEFYVDRGDNLKIKGYGDPLLVSEVVSGIARELVSRANRFHNIILDDSYFVQPLEIPGVSNSSEPYDAPNGALCVNFNTINFKKENGIYISAEPQTPLLPFALKRVQQSNLNRGRIVLSHNENECTLYAGHLFKYFLRLEGINPSGKVTIGTVQEDIDRLIYRYYSRFSLEEIITKLLEHSNNFTTNQVLIATGIDVYGPPGTLSKGVRAVTAYAKEILQLESIYMTEGSGISRANRISARDLYKILDGFAPYRYLLRHEGREYYKTGTLYGISTRAGYIEGADGKLYHFVIMINTPGKSTNDIAKKLLKALE